MNIFLDMHNLLVTTNGISSYHHRTWPYGHCSYAVHVTRIALHDLVTFASHVDHLIDVGNIRPRSSDTESIVTPKAHHWLSKAYRSCLLDNGESGQL